MRCGGQVEVERSSILWLYSWGQQIQQRLSWGPCISTNENSDRFIVDSLSSFDQKLLKIADCCLEVGLIDEGLNLWLDILFQHVAFEVGDLNSIVFTLVVTCRNDDSQMFVGLGLIVQGNESSNSKGNLSDWIVT